MEMEGKNVKNLDGNILRFSQKCQKKNLENNMKSSVRIAMKSSITPVRVQRKRTKGFRLQDASPNGLPVVYVGRPSKWANPFRIGIDGDREAVVRKFREYAMKKLKEDPNWLEPLRGKDLACWCPLDKPCHADVLIELLRKEAGK